MDGVNPTRGSRVVWNQNSARVAWWVSAAFCAALVAGPAAHADRGDRLEVGGSLTVQQPLQFSDATDATDARSEDPAAALPVEGETSSAPASAPSAAEIARSARESLALGSPQTAAVHDAQAKGWLPGVSPGMAELIRIGGGLGAVLLLIVILRMWIRAYGMNPVASGRPSGIVEILARYPVSRGQSMIVVRFGRQIVLTHHAGGTMTTLCEISDPDEVARMLARLEAGASGRDAERFRTMLQRFDREYDRDEVVRGGRGNSAANGAAESSQVVEIVDLTRGGRRRTASVGQRGGG